MVGVRPDVLFESLAMVGYLVLAGVLTVGGLFVEYVSWTYVSGGDLALGLWLAAFGVILLYVGLYAVGYQRLLAGHLAAQR